MARQFSISPNQAVLWSRHELTRAYTSSKTWQGTRRAVPLACPSWWSTAVNHGHSVHRGPAQPQVSKLPGQEQDQRPTFQAGHAGSIPVTRSFVGYACSRSALVLLTRHFLWGRSPHAPPGGLRPRTPSEWLRWILHSQPRVSDCLVRAVGRGRDDIMARIDYYRDPGAPGANSIVVAVSAVVFDGVGRVLFIRRSDNGLYSIPGGEVEVGETLTQALKREVLEETGVVVEVSGLVGVYSDPEHVIAYSDGEVRQEFSVCFRAFSVGGGLRTSQESTEVLWVGAGRVAGLDVHPAVRLRVRHGLAGRAQAFFT